MGIVILLGAVGVGAVALAYGTRRWRAATRALHAKMEAARSPVEPREYNAGELEGLPAPVRRYFQTALRDGQPMIAGVHVAHAGTFNMSEIGEQWKPFTSAQRVVTRPPGFVWDARIRMAPGLSVFVHDAYVAGEGVLTAQVLGLATVMKQAGTPDLAQGELMRFVAEAAWYPTALLPSQGVHWEAVDDTHAAATLADGEATVTLIFTFDARGLISMVQSTGRYRQVAGVQVATPWQGRFWDYAWRDNMLVPQQGEVAWLLPEGSRPYWRARMMTISYEFAR